MGSHRHAEPLIHRRLARRAVSLAAGCIIAGAAAGATACSDFLTGPGVSQDPNNITALTRPGALYLSVQRVAAGFDGPGFQVPPTLYTQQLAGLGRQAEQIDGYNLPGGGFGAVYGGGGLLDIRKVQQLARDLHDSLYVGIAKVHEALRMGYAAAMWGDIPYREAADSNNTQPQYDPQLQVYADIQAQLDSAVQIYLPAAGATNAGPGLDGSELIYAGRDAAGLRAVYTAVARSLKARFFLHVAEASRARINGAPPFAYDSAIKYAALGIASPEDDFLWFYDLPLGDVNPWWQQISVGADVAAGAAMVEILKRRIAQGIEDDRRLSFYFTPASDGEYRGFRPTGAAVTTAGGIYDGTGPYSGMGAFLDATASDGSFRTPAITYAETQLIAAEAAWQLGCVGCTPIDVAAAAQPFLDSARHDRRYGATSDGPVLFGDAPGVLPASLVNIMEEKYLTLFLNPEVWTDWKRTCLPSLAPALGAPSIPGRFPYPGGETNANPNTPTISSTGVPITSVSRNPNQPDVCPTLDYISSSPLAN
jgi:hypothetical protein